MYSKTSTATLTATIPEQPQMNSPFRILPLATLRLCGFAASRGESDDTESIDA
jgi:hypothetical protein